MHFKIVNVILRIAQIPLNLWIVITSSDKTVVYIIRW